MAQRLELLTEPNQRCEFEQPYAHSTETEFASMRYRRVMESLDSVRNMQCQPNPQYVHALRGCHLNFELYEGYIRAWYVNCRDQTELEKYKQRSALLRGRDSDAFDCYETFPPSVINPDWFREQLSLMAC